MFLKNKNIIFKSRRSKVTDYAALSVWDLLVTFHCCEVYMSTFLRPCAEWMFQTACFKVKQIKRHMDRVKVSDTLLPQGHDREAKGHMYRICDHSLSRVLFNFENISHTSLSKNINPSWVLVQPRKTGPFITEDCWWDVKNQIKQKKKNFTHIHVSNLLL